MRSRLLLVFVFALPLAAAACGGEEPRTGLSYTQNAQKAYEAAMEEFRAHNWIEAQSQFRELKRKYSYTKYARLAELRIADADFEQEKFSDAIREYRQFIHDHRSENEDVAYARSRIAEADYAQIPDSFLLPSAEERDQAIVLDAYKELRGFLHDYPSSKESRRVRELLLDVTARLVKHELYVARFYLGKDNFDAAIARIQYALRNYSAGIGGAAGDVQGDSGLEPEALLLLGETYLKMHKWNEARTAFSVLLQRFPKSALRPQARNYLDYMQKRGV
jgi:outer membrane protein assembly factor BamD